MSGGMHLTKGSPRPFLPDDGLVHLYSMRFCPYAHRVHLILDAKQIPYHSIYINLHEKPDWLTTVSPLGKVPALALVKEPDNPILIESLIICEYLDEKYPHRKLLPSDPLKKAKDKILIERFNVVSTAMYKMCLSDGPLSDLWDGLDIFNRELQVRTTPFFGGDSIGFLDYMIWPWIERLDMLKFLFSQKYELDENRFENLLNWRDLMLNDEAVRIFYLEGKIHAKYIRSRIAGTPDYDMLVKKK